jgi:hypothetical protein
MFKMLDLISKLDFEDKKEAKLVEDKKEAKLVEDIKKPKLDFEVKKLAESINDYSKDAVSQIMTMVEMFFEEEGHVGKARVITLSYQKHFGCMPITDFKPKEDLSEEAVWAYAMLAQFEDHIQGSRVSVNPFIFVHRNESEPVRQMPLANILKTKKMFSQPLYINNLWDVFHMFVYRTMHTHWLDYAPFDQCLRNCMFHEYKKDGCFRDKNPAVPAEYIILSAIIKVYEDEEKNAVTIRKPVEGKAGDALYHYLEEVIPKGAQMAVLRFDDPRVFEAMKGIRMLLFCVAACKMD